MAALAALWWPEEPPPLGAQENGAGVGPETEEDNSDEEDTSDAAFAARHAPWEQEERKLFQLASAGVQQHPAMPVPLSPRLTAL